MSGILIDVNARTSKSEQDLAKINESLRNIEKTASGASKALSNAFVGIGAALVSGSTLAALKNISSEFTNLENKIALVTGKTDQLIVAQTQLSKIAEETRSTFAGTVSIFSSFGKSLKSAGTSTENILKATKAVQQAIAISGSSAESASAALVQLGQGLASGVLRGEELNSVLEQAPRLAQAIADEVGVSIGQLRRLGEQGALVSDVVFKAILNQSKAINKEFETLSPTLQQASSALTDALKFYVNELDKGLGLSQQLGAITFSLAKYIKQASQNAFEFGNNLRLSINSIQTTILSILVPVSKIISELGKQFANIIPKATLTRTLRGDVREAIRIIDKDFLGGVLTRVSAFRFVDLFTVESDVEKAIRKLKRLSPRYWAASGFDVKTIRQVLSTENIRLYGEAFSELAIALEANTKGLGATFVNFARKLDFGFKALSRYLGFRVDTILAFSRGQLDTFFVTLGEITRGITGVRIKIYEFQSLLISALQPGIEAFADAVIDSLAQLPAGLVNFTKSMISAGIKVIEILKQITKELLFSELNINYKEILDTILDTISNFSSAVANFLGFGSTLDNIKKFGKEVIEVFRDIYDKVIGNSWWTDTVENIVDTSNTLWSRTSNGLSKFKNNVINLFKDIFTSRASFDFKLDKKISFVDVFDKISSKGFANTFSNVFDSLKNAFVQLFESFPSLLKVALAGVGAVVVYSLFPSSIFKTAIITSLVSSILTNSSLLAEKFGAALTGGSLAATVGYALGQGAGFFINQFIKDLPQVLNAIAGFVSAAFRGIAEQLPIVGGIVSLFASLTDKLGVVGPAGLIGLYLFGKNFNLLETITKLKPIKKILDFFDIKFGADSSKDTKKAGPVNRVFNYLFGTLGKERTIAGMLSLLDILGVFESIFANSPLAQLATRGGILYTVLFGEKGVVDAKNAFAKYITKPLGAALENLANKGGTVTKTVYDLIFGEGTFAERASLLLKPAIDKVVGSVIDYVSPKLKTGFDFLSKLLLGKDPKETTTKIVNNFKDTVNNILKSVSKIAKPITEPIIETLDAKRYERWLRKNANPDTTGRRTWAFGAKDSFMEAQMKSASKAFDDVARNAAKTVNDISGQNGLLGKLFLGKYGKAIIIGSILSVFSAFAFANVQAQKELESPFDSLVEEVKKIDLLEPFKNLSTFFVSVTVVSLISGFLLFRGTVLKVFSEIKAVALSTMATVAASAGATGLATLLAGGVGGAGKRKTKAAKREAIASGGALAVGAAAGVATGFATDALTGAAAGLIVAQLFQSLPAALAAGILTGIKTALLGIGEFLTSPIFLGGLALTLVGGAIGVWLFGKNREFFKDLQAAYDGVREFFGLKPTEKPSSRGLAISNEEFLRSRAVESTFSLEKVNLKALDAADLKKLKEKTEEYSKAIERAREKETETGKISEETRNELKLLDKGLANFTAKLAVKSNQIKTSPVEFIESLQKGFSPNLFSDFAFGVQQALVDLDFNAREFLIKARGFLASTPERKATAAADLAVLRSQRDTRFNVLFRPLAETEKGLLDLAKAAQKVTITNDDLELSLQKARDLYEKEAERIRSQQTNLFGRFAELPPSATAALTILRAEYSDLLRQRIAFDRVRVAANEYSKELTSLNTVFKEVLGIEIDFKDIFASDQVDLKRLKDLREEAKKLGDQLLDVSNIGRQNEIILRIKEVRTQVTETVEKAQRQQSTLRPQVLARELGEKINRTESKEFYDALSDSAARALISAYEDIEKATKAAREKGIPSLDIYGKDKTRVSEVLKGTPTATLEQVNKEIRDVNKRTDNLIKDSIRGTAGELVKLQSDAEKLSVPFDILVEKYGVKGSIDILDKYRIKLDEFEEAKRNRDDTRVVKLSKEISRFREELSKVPLDLQSALGYLNSGQFSISPEDIFRTKEIFNQSMLLSRSIYLIEERFKKASAGISQIEFDKLIGDKLENARKLFDVFVKTVGNTPAKLTQIFQKFGSESIDLTNLPQSAISAGKLIEKIQLKLDQLESTGKVSDFRLFKLLRKQLDILVADFKSKLPNSFESIFNKINSGLEINLSEGQLAQLPNTLVDSLSKYADFVQLNLQNLRKSKDIAGEAPKEFFNKFEEIQRKVSFVKFFSDFNKSFGRIAIEGFGDQFERIKQAISDFSLDKESFAQLPAGLRKQLAEDASLLNVIKTVIETLPGISEEQAGILSKLLPDASNIKGVFDEFSTSVLQNITNVPEDIRKALEFGVKSQIDPINLQIDAINNNSKSVNELRDSIIELQNLLIKGGSAAGFASGGYVRGPGSGTSDSIPAMLSDGEFVINAKSTKKHRNLLESINKFGKGGAVDLAKRSFLKVDELKLKAKNSRDAVEAATSKAKEDFKNNLDPLDVISNLDTLNEIKNRRQMFGPAALKTLFDLRGLATKWNILGTVGGFGYALGENVVAPLIDKAIETSTGGEQKTLGDYLYYLLNEKQKESLGSTWDGFAKGGPVKKYYGYTIEDLLNPSVENLATPYFPENYVKDLLDIKQNTNSELIKNLGLDVGLDYKRGMSLPDQVKFSEILSANLDDTIKVLRRYHTDLGLNANPSTPPIYSGYNAARIDLDKSAGLSARMETKIPNPFDKTLFNTLYIPKITPDVNILSAYSIATHEIGHLISLLRSIDPYSNIDDILPVVGTRVSTDAEQIRQLSLAAFKKNPAISSNQALQELLSSMSSLEPVASFLHFSGTGKKNLLNEFEALKKDPNKFVNNRFEGLEKMSPLLVEEMMASNISNMFNPIPRYQTWDDLSKAFATYKLNQMKEEIKALTPYSSSIFEKATMGATVDILHAKTVKEITNNFKEAPKPERKFNFLDKIKDSQINFDKIKEILPNKEKLAEVLKDKNPFRSGIVAKPKALDLVSLLADLGMSAYNLTTGVNPLDLSVDAVKSGSAFLKGISSNLAFQLATYSKSAEAATLTKTQPEIMIQRMFEENEAALASQERFKQAYKPQVDTKLLKNKNVTRSLVNYEGYLPDNDRIRKFLEDLNIQSYQLSDKDIIEKALKFSKAKKKATGGFVFGPGSATSDSIPAWLSNGEFVVNAKASSKYRNLLESINSAKGFNKGTASSGTPPTIVEGNVLADLVNTLRQLSTSLERRATEALPKDLKTIVKGRQLNLDLDELKFKALEPGAQKKLEDLVNKAYDAEVTSRKQKTPQAYKAAQATLDEANNFIEENLPKFTNRIRDASNAFADDITKTTSEAFKDLLKGRSDENKTALQTFLSRIADTFTNAVINTFTDALLEPLTGKEGLLTKQLRGLGKELATPFTFGTTKPGEQKASDVGFLDSLKEGFSSFLSPILNFLGPIGASIASLFSLNAGTPVFEINALTLLTGIQTTLGGILAAVSSKAASDATNMFSDISAFAFASGGYVSGPGTATSDSIPALLSDGEFVVNAKSASKNIKVLTAINNGSFKKLAEGGLVSTDVVATPTITKIPERTVQQSTQQVFNINVTGDISRQTKSEILGMLPQIAAGVNKQNREKRV